ncbi:alpha/beta fold hydrolase [Corynebacterium sp. HMSC29G08]|uniref:alpha/beta fold hydrolase n=1 Tax=Corynebacterium sp. HMSC29G08 TaxID=1581069 RepID=UPI00143C0682|nr:alpha/beta hydrolase [Corynebacterium sp. HMSC29G08]
MRLSRGQPANDQPANERQANERPEQEKQYGKLAAMDTGMNTGMETHRTPHGEIRYWVSRTAGKDRPWLVFLPGMLTDHRLFGAQLTHFAGKANTFVWDAPAHGMSRPYELSAISVDRIARELIAILSTEGITRPVLVGQSFGGVVAQRVMQCEPALASGFIGIGTMPLTREYWNPLLIAGLKHVGPLLHLRTWDKILDHAPRETSHTAKAQGLTRTMLKEYTKSEYVALADVTFKAVARGVGKQKPWQLPCPTALVVGEYDRTGGIGEMGKRWAADEGLALHVIPEAAHNTNADNPAAVNAIIDQFIQR